MSTSHRQCIRKERPLPPAKPPAKPPTPTGIRAPGGNTPSNGMIVSGSWLRPAAPRRRA
jgi:hypothetical protein